MNLLSRFRWLLLVPVLLIGAVLLLALQLPDSGWSTLTRLLVALCIAIGLMELMLWRQLWLRLVRPLAALEQSSEILLRCRSGQSPELPANHLLGRLPEQLALLGEALVEARAEVSRALRTGEERVSHHRQQLERVIRGLDEGVVVCDGQGQILLYNPAAQSLLHHHPALGLGRSIYDLLPRATLGHNLDQLRRTADPGRFLCALEEHDRLLRCRLNLLGEADGEAQRPGFVLAFEDVTEQQQQLLLRDQLFSEAVERLRGPLASLRSAAEALVAYPDMEAGERAAFHQLVAEESGRLSGALEQLSADEAVLIGQHWELVTLYSADLIHLLRRRLAERRIELTMTGVPQWIRTDSQALVALLEQLAAQVAVQRGVAAFDLEAWSSERRVYLDLAWQGAPLGGDELERCRDTVLKEVVGQPTLGSLLVKLGSELWSQPHPRIEGMALLRLPLPRASTGMLPPEDPLPTRPMVYDFDLFEREAQPDQLLDTPLRRLSYVVFDTETTGLNPGEGDEVVSIAAVRIVNQRILPDETFERLVNPGRPIPRESTRYHGITDAMVERAPTLTEVLPEFCAFARGAVLVAHNAWFDLAFLRRYEVKAGVRLTNPVLDTLMLSVCLHGRDVDQSLDAIAERMGIEIFGRHSALGDSLATARLLLAQIDLLEARGIVTLREALDAYR